MFAPLGAGLGGVHQERRLPLGDGQFAEIHFARIVDRGWTQFTHAGWAISFSDGWWLGGSVEEDAVSLRADLGKGGLRGRGGVGAEAEPGRGHACRPRDRGRVLDESPREP
jgi:hypothetical protein